MVFDGRFMVALNYVPKNRHLGNECEMAVANASGDVRNVMDKITFLKELPQLNAATSEEGTAIAGHVYRQISDLTLSSGSHCQDILDFLVDRLENPSCVVKFKTLKMMQFLVTHGHPQFRQQLRRHATGITETTKFTGPIGSSVSKEHYSRVRKEAEILCESLFHIESDDTKVPHPFSSTVINTGGMGAMKTDSHGMEGFGNTRTDVNKSLGSRLTEQIVKFVDAAIDPLPTRTAQVTTHSLARVDIMQRSIPDDLDIGRQMQRNASSYSRRNRRNGHRPGVAGGGWDDSTNGAGHNSCDGDGGSQPSVDDSESLGGTATDSLHKSDTHQPDDMRRDSVDARETDLVDAVVSPSSDSSTADIPSRREIAAFRERCATLNCDAVLRCLNDKLTNENSTTVMRSLVLLECLLNSDLISADLIWVTCGDNIHYVRTHDNTPNGAKAKCRKLLLILQKLSGSEILNITSTAQVSIPHRTED